MSEPESQSQCIVNAVEPTASAIEPRSESAGVPISPGLARRLASATKSVEALALDGENTFHHYKYPTIAQVRERANHALAEAGISIVPSVVRVGQKTRTSSKGTAMIVTAVELAITIASEDGSYLAAWTGESEDAGDKGVQKAISAAMKAFLSNLLLIPVSEPENDAARSRGKRSRRRGASKVQAALYDTEPPAQNAKSPTAPARHWIDDVRVRTRFWAWCREQLALTDSDVLTALDVPEVRWYAGTMQDAKSAIEKYVADRAGANEQTTETAAGTHV